MCVLTASVWDAESQCMYIFVIPMEYIYIYICIHFSVRYKQIQNMAKI